ncbi:conserved hypothetical protein [Mesorhizobium sp. STM 4661]|nr:conserved hypothetical protein [Mesorhizobium sp. STM 4661]
MVVIKKCAIAGREEDVFDLHFTSLDSHQMALMGGCISTRLPNYAPLGVEFANIISEAVPSRFQIADASAKGIAHRSNSLNRARRSRSAFTTQFLDGRSLVIRQLPIVVPHCGERAYVGRQPDGSLALIPIWITQETAVTMAVGEAPRLALWCLRDLRREIDACVGFLQGDTRRSGGHHATQTMSNQPARPVLRGDPASSSTGRSAGKRSSVDRRFVEGSHGDEPEGPGGKS